MKNVKKKATAVFISLIVIVVALIIINIVRKFVPAVPKQDAAQTTQTVQGSRSGGSGQSGGSRNGGGQGGSGQAGGAGQGSGGNQGSRSQGSGGQGGSGQSGQRSGTAIRITPVTLGTVEKSVILNGDVLSSSQVSIYPVMGGKLTDLRIRVGDRVMRGQLIAMVDPSRPGDPFFPSPVTSTVSGAVVSIPVNIGDTLQTNSVICVIGNLADLRVETYVPERFSVNMHKGLPAQISFEAMPGEIFPAEVDEISPVLDASSRTLRISLRLLPGGNGRVDSRILAGMFATISLVTNSRVDVPVIPRTALIHTYGNWIVFTVPEDSSIARRVEVSLGLESETMVEILSGLETGDLVVSMGQNFLADGDPVRILE